MKHEMMKLFPMKSVSYILMLKNNAFDTCEETQRTYRSYSENCVPSAWFTRAEAIEDMKTEKQEGHEALNRSPEYTGQKSNI